MTIPRFDFEAPETLDEACRLLAGAPGEAALLAGGTDLVVQMKRGVRRPALVVSLSRVPGLASVARRADGAVALGPLCTMTTLAESSVLGPAEAGLAEGAAAVAGPLVRNRATVGGNVVNARPCADTVPALVALDARLTLRGPAGEREVPLDGFITGPGRTGLAPGEILCRIMLPVPGGPTGSAYLKVTRRAAMDITVVGCAARVTLDAAGERVTAARLVYTSVAPVPLRVPAAERALAGRAPDDDAFRDAAATARAAVTPIDDFRAPADYRREVAEVLTRRALAAAVARARGRTCP